MSARAAHKPDLEKALAAMLERAGGEHAPPQLAQALAYSVFPGGARIRPKLCLAVAAANRCDDMELAMRAACAVELLHCASLVHDDLPCFDDADTRRGKPSVHRAFGEAIAVLAGDALIVAGFECVGAGSARTPERLAAVITVLARGVGSPFGICAGQAWESETDIDLARYHQAKTGALFVAATAAGAASAGADIAPWSALGTSIGEAYQVADDIQDAIATEEALGKPCGQDVAHARPSAVKELGVQGAARKLRQLVECGLDSVPPCPGRNDLLALVRSQAQGFLPKGLSRRAA